ncbi:MAG: CHAD domain-containing protein [Thermoanaerobaculia bacterium]
MTPSEESFHLESQTSGRQVLKAIASRFPTRREPLPNRKSTYYDTFDWRLHGAGSVLEATTDGQATILRWQTLDGRLRERLQLDGVLAFAWDLPAGSLRSALSPLVEMRRLLPVVHLEASGEALQILDENRKTVARVVLEKASARRPDETGQGRSLPPTLRAIPVKGYQRAFTELHRFLNGESQLEPAPSRPLDLALAAIDRQPGDYGSKLDLRLEPDQRADEALKQIFRSLLHTIKANEPGLRSNLDSEFLHDFRVAVRRTRSALSQLKGIYLDEVTSTFRQEFTWLGKVTGPTRDLDVNLLKMADYRALLPQQVRADLEPLNEFLERHRKLEHRKMVRALGGKRYGDLIDRWQAFLDQPPADGDLPRNALTPIGELAVRRIWKAYRRVLEKGGAIVAETPPEALHRLRIEAKKLRYLLEFFRSLYDAEEIGRLVKALKQLQDNLGDFNDFVVQQDTLARFAQQMVDDHLEPAETLMAMGRLQERLEAGQEREREDFHRRFEEFSAPGNRKLFRRLFKQQEASER